MCTKCGKVFINMNHYNVQRHESHKRTEKQKSVVATKADSAGSVKTKIEQKFSSILVTFVGNFLRT